jgi:hypothetical protein
MGNRPFALPIQKTKEVPDLTEWGNLKNKFSGKTLFRSKLYYLETGDLSILDNISNKWFFDELIAYSRANQDINLLPALKKIAGSGKFDESLRQHASEVVEIIEEQVNKDKNQPKTASTGDEFEKATNARKILFGTRYPQTTEILRLLRDKSPELKRLALFLIGKFKMTDMIQEVCECLNVHGIEDDAFSVLQSFGSAAAKEVDRYYLTASGNINAGKILLRLLSKIHPPENMSFLVERLWSNSRLIKEMSLKTLINTGYQVNENEKDRLKKNIFEIFGTLTWITAAQVSLKDSNEDTLSAEMDKEYIRWKDYLLNLLSLTYNGQIESENEKGQKDIKDDLSRSIPELARIIYAGASKPGTDDSPDSGSYKKKLKKLQRYFPCEIPGYKNLLEDIINCDYNLIGIWTKACAIRNIPEIEEEDMGESVVALLFSPEELLRQEAARLITRSGKELYKTTSERIPEATRKQLDKIIEGEICEKELVFEKVRFLSSCFKGINEDELLFLADKLAFARNDQRGIYSQPSNSILWSFPSEKGEPEIFVNQEDITDPGNVIKDIRTTCFYCYVLPLITVREFNFQYPESSFGVFKYIDNCEE